MSQQEPATPTSNYKSRNRKRLIVLCDGKCPTETPKATFSDNLPSGTWQDSTSAAADDEYPSNVTRFSRALKPYAVVRDPTTGNTEEVEQIVYYQKGVGTGALDSVLGGAAGLGVSANVRSAYAFLAHNYDAGDQIFFVGFSRGAYTARAVAGLVCAHGLLTKRGMDSFGDLYRLWYRLMDERAREGGGGGQAAEQRRRNKRRWRTPEERAFLRRLVADGLVDEGARNAVEIVACWDTVAFHQTWFSRTWVAQALGLGGEQLEFHSEVLSPRVRYGFHALALDERRAAFQPTMWEAPPPPPQPAKRPRQNGTAENGTTAARTGAGYASDDSEDTPDAHDQASSTSTETDTDTEAPEPHRLTRLDQVWFAGNHSDVGGGHADHRLSDIPLAWMLARCRATGLLAFDDAYLLGRLSRSRREPAGLGSSWATAAGATRSGRWGVWWVLDRLARWLPYVSRDRAPAAGAGGEQSGEEVHVSVADRRFGANGGAEGARRYECGALTGRREDGRWEVRGRRGRVWLPQAEVLEDEEWFKGRIRAADNAWVDEVADEGGEDG